MIVLTRPSLRRPAAAPRQPASTTGRLLTIDALRGLAMVLMALNHTSYFVFVSVWAEHRVGFSTVLSSWPYWVTGLISFGAPTIFWLVSGVSIALLNTSRARRGESRWSTIRYLWVRAGLLLVLDTTVFSMAWGFAVGRLDYDFSLSVLSSLAVGMLLMSLLQFLPDRVIIILMLMLLAGYQWMVERIFPVPTQPHDFWLALWLVPSDATTPKVWFPVLGWFGLMGLGFALGRRLSSPVLQDWRTWGMAGAGLLAGWLTIRLSGGYGNFVPYAPGDPWHYLLIMSKWPPSLDYFTFTLAITMLAMAAFCSLSQLLQRPPLGWLVILGQASLIFYVAHPVVYGCLARLGQAVLGTAPGIVRYYLIWAVGLAMLLVFSDAYRRLRQRPPRSLWRYL
jgi:uncharacterized membrane protein